MTAGPVLYNTYSILLPKLVTKCSIRHHVYQDLIDIPCGTINMIFNFPFLLCCILEGYKNVIDSIVDNEEIPYIGRNVCLVLVVFFTDCVYFKLSPWSPRGLIGCKEE